MTKRQIQKLLKFEKLFDRELSTLYTECMMELFPMQDTRSHAMPTKKKIARAIEKKIKEQHVELSHSKLISSIIVRFVSKKYEVIER